MSHQVFEPVLLTAKQAATMEFIRAYTQEHGFPPSLREVAVGMGLKSHQCLHRLRILIRKGFIAHAPGTARGLRVVLS